GIHACCFSRALSAGSGARRWADRGAQGEARSRGLGAGKGPHSRGGEPPHSRGRRRSRRGSVADGRRTLSTIWSPEGGPEARHRSEDGRTEMNASKLDALRRKYGGAKGGDIFEPRFAEVAAKVFSGGDERKWPFAGAAAFLGLPYRPDAASAPDFGGIDAALIGVPMDLGVTNRAGARLGPRAVRAVERIGPYEHALGIAPLLHVQAADVGDVPMKSRFSLEQCHADIEAFFGRVRDAGVIPLAVGGDHSVTYPVLRALGRGRPVGMVHIDAHC